MYQRLSRYYDRLMGDFPYDRYVQYLTPYVGTKGLDLACGTGQMTMRLAEKGMRMQGVDSQQSMLNVAIDRSRKQGLHILYRCEDMRDFGYTVPYDLITAVCDGVNYIPPGDLPAFLQRVAGALADGGHLAFDVSTPYKLRRVLGDNLFFEDYPDLTYYWQNHLLPRKQAVRFSLTFFEAEGGHYLRSDETHLQYWHTRTAIMAAAQAAGLRLTDQCDGDTFGAVCPKSKRVVYVFGKVL